MCYEQIFKHHGIALKAYKSVLKCCMSARYKCDACEYPGAFFGHFKRHKKCTPLPFHVINVNNLTHCLVTFKLIEKFYYTHLGLNY